MDEPLRLPPPRPTDDPSLITFGGAVDRCSVGLRVRGDDLDPAAVTALLGATPTFSCRRGDVHRGPRYDRVERWGRWSLELDDTGAALDDLLNRLLDRLTADLAAWRELVGRYDADLFCGLFLDQFNRGLSLSPRTLLRIGERGIELGLDIYCCADSEPPAA